MKVPSIGFAGVASQTRAAQLTFAKAMGARGGRRSAARRRKKKAAAVGGRRRTRRTRKAARLVKGSRAAKAYMAKIRRKRK